MAVVFSKLSGKNDGFYKAVEGVLTEHILDVDTGKNNDDKVLESMFKVKKSSKFGERQGGMTEFSNFREVEEGGKGINDSITEGFAKLLVHKSFSKSFSTTREMIDDGDLDMMKTAASNFTKAYKRSKLDFATGFITSEESTFNYEGKIYDATTGDGKAIFATDHPGKASGTPTQSNIFTNELGSTISVLNKLANIGRNLKNESGIQLGYTYDTLIIPGNRPEMEETANRIIYTSQGAVGTDLNDINTQKGKWRLIVNHRWEVTEAGHNPFLIMSSESASALNSLPFYNRVALDVRNEIDNNTRNLIWNGYTRFSCGCFNWRSVIMGGAKVGTTFA